MNQSEAVQAIIKARRNCVRYNIPDHLAQDSLSDAYEFQTSVAQEMFKVRDSSGVGGFKLAVNGKPQMDYFGVNEPVSGIIHAREIFPSPATYPEDQFMSLAIEPEIAAIIGPGIENFSGIPSRENAARCIEKFVPALEVIDMGGLEIKDCTLSEAVALNIFNAGCVLGKEGIPPQNLSLETTTATLTIDGKTIDEKTNNAPQHPLDAVAWLIGHLENRPFELKPGMVILCGTHIPLFSVPAGTRQIDMNMTGLGSASMSITAD